MENRKIKLSIKKNDSLEFDFELCARISDLSIELSNEISKIDISPGQKPADFDRLCYLTDLNRKNSELSEMVWRHIESNLDKN